ncbi:inositol monophosphatase family protein [Lunatibacter salilacus]|uniref:inositol monophosphatase family protein n=1 Tax=Lunatibacter salilacus TaxID=2483804 RepID=UPI00131C15E8|nr:inositol monophosphatase family protein [Lunatibacter salilacus]
MNLEKILKPTIEIAKKAGAFIRKERQNFNHERVENKGFNDLVSYVDKEAEKMIVSGLKDIFPEAGFITEEGTVDQTQTAWKWIVDPLDGTTNFVHGVPVFSVSIALAHEGRIMLGVVYEVNLSECFYAYRGGGAFCNDTRIHVSGAATLSESLIATGFPYQEGGKIDRYLELLKYLLLNSHGLRRLGSAAVDLCYVASGRVEAYMEYNLQSYDVAAGTLILEEAGGKVTDFSGGGNYIFGGEIIASNGKIHESLRKKMDEIFAAKAL